VTAIDLDTCMKHRLTVEFDDFGFDQLDRAARAQGVPLETLVAHAAMYYLADLENGRAAARVFSIEQDAEAPAPLRRSAED
jgi:hypothetical protein